MRRARALRTRFGRRRCRVTLCSSAETGLDLLVKHENHNPTSAFKVRGGLNLVRSLRADQRRRGVVTARTGNHGQSIALACQLAGVAVHGLRAARQQSREERRDSRPGRDRHEAAATSTRRASAARRAGRGQAARATCIRPTSRCWSRASPPTPSIFEPARRRLSSCRSAAAAGPAATAWCARALGFGARHRRPGRTTPTRSRGRSGAGRGSWVNRPTTFAEGHGDTRDLRLHVPGILSVNSTTS